MRLLEGMLRKKSLPITNCKNIHGNLIFTTFEPSNLTKMKYRKPYTLFGTKETVYFLNVAKSRLLLQIYKPCKMSIFVFKNRCCNN